MEAYGLAVVANIFNSLGKNCGTGKVIVLEKQERVWKYNTGRLGGANGDYPKVKQFIKISGVELIECREIRAVVTSFAYS